MNRRDSENLLGSVETFHCVILATGYQHHFSFITDESLRLRISGNAGLDTYRNKGATVPSSRASFRCRAGRPG